MSARMGRLVLFVLIEGMPAIDYSHQQGTVVQFPFSGYQQGHRRPGAFHVFRYEESIDPRQVRAQPHRHDFYQLLWLEEGGGELISDFNHMRFGPKVLAFFSPGLLHAWKHEVEPRGIMFGFTPEFFHTNSDCPGLLGRLQFLHEAAEPMMAFSGESAREMSHWFSQLHVEAARNLPGRDDIVRAIITIILSKARQHHEGPAAEAARSGEATVAGSLTQRFRLALEQHFPKLLKVSEYARLLHVSRTHLNDDLRMRTGQTASELIHERLLLEAKRLLVYSTSLTVAEVAYQLQFQDPSYFGRFFRHRTGLSPGAYREQELARQAKV